MAVPTLLDHAKAELQTSLRTTDHHEAVLLRRQVAEKTWGHLTEHADRILGIPGTGRRAHVQRAELLRELDRVHGTSFRQRYEDLRNDLHGRCFYEAHCPPDVVREGVRKAEEFLREMEEVVRRSRNP